MISVRFPYPFSETVRMVFPSVGISIPMTRSSPAILIPRTPRAVRPMSRTSPSLKRIDLPFRVPRKMSWFPRVSWTSISSSPSSMEIAMIPPARGLEKAESSVFLIVPFLVTMTTDFSPVNSRTGRTAATRSRAPTRRSMR